jgi:hypothetical protein
MRNGQYLSSLDDMEDDEDMMLDEDDFESYRS